MISAGESQCINSVLFDDGVYRIHEPESDTWYPVKSEQFCGGSVEPVESVEGQGDSFAGSAPAATSDAQSATSVENSAKRFKDDLLDFAVTFAKNLPIIGPAISGAETVWDKGEKLVESGLELYDAYKAEEAQAEAEKAEAKALVKEMTKAAAHAAAPEVEGEKVEEAESAETEETGQTDEASEPVANKKKFKKKVKQTPVDEFVP